MRILVCGGRNYGHVVRTASVLTMEPPDVMERLQEYNYIQACLNEIINSNLADPNNNWLPSDVTIISGGANGADKAAEDFAAVNFCILDIFPADWNKHGKSAGYIRNKQMLDEGKPDLVVAFPGGKGTKMMVDLAINAGVKVIKMGAKGSQTMVDLNPKFQTKKYEKIYCDRMGELRGFATPGQRTGILRDLLEEEKNWIANMGSEYDEIMQAKEIVDDLSRGG